MKGTSWDYLVLMLIMMSPAFILLVNSLENYFERTLSLRSPVLVIFIIYIPANSTFIDELDYYKYNVNLIVDKINNPLRNQIGGKKNK